MKRVDSVERESTVARHNREPMHKCARDAFGEKLRRREGRKGREGREGEAKRIKWGVRSGEGWLRAERSEAGGWTVLAHTEV